MRKCTIHGGFWDLAAAHCTSIDGQDNNLPYLDAIVRPKAIGFAEDVGLAIVLDGDACGSVLRLHPMQVD